MATTRADVLAASSRTPGPSSSTTPRSTQPPEPNGFYVYNPLQKLAYFGVVFVLAPLAIITGPSMSPAFTARSAWYPKLPSNRQVGRSIHFLVLCAFVVFIIGHVTMVALTGLVRNMNHIVLGTDTTDPIGVYARAGWDQRGRPGECVRPLHGAEASTGRPARRQGNRHSGHAGAARPGCAAGRVRARRHLALLWVNGKMPTSDEWNTLAAGDFKDYRLKVRGLVENPVDLSGRPECAGPEVPDHAAPLYPRVVGHRGVGRTSAGGTHEVGSTGPQGKVDRLLLVWRGVDFNTGIAGGQYYDSLSIENALHPQTLLAYEMNYRSLHPLHGAPLRLRVENQLGFKMVKWIKAIEFVENVHSINQGEGGYAEDHEYFGELANI